MSDGIIKSNRPKPVALIILDGWGIAPPSDGNAITEAKTPNINKLISTYPALTLVASGDSAGLSWGEMGNSEVGHLNLGAGKVFYQNLPKINKSITDGSFFSNRVFLKAADFVKKNNSKLHLLGLVSSGGVHASIEHLFALLEMAKRQSIKKVFVHVVLDGRDSIYNSGLDFTTKLLAKMKELGVGQIATISGRFYAMDRDNHWERTEKVYNAMTRGESDEKFSDPIEAIKKSYDKKIFDEEFVPAVMANKNAAAALVEEKDAIIFFNFRSDRAREITKAFIIPEFSKFERPKYLDNIMFVTMTEYEEGLPVEVAFPVDLVKEPLAKVLSEAGLKQLHIAETEKYAHVTFFFNGGAEEPFLGEDRAVIPSPRVSSYDQKPEMSALEITNQVVKEVKENKYDFILINFANADMVSHTGDKAATIKAVETIDKCVGKLVDVILSNGGVAVVTADHGNAEELVNLQTGVMDKEHSTNPVPLIIIGKEWEGKTGGAREALGSDLSLMPPQGLLSDVAPTILKIMGLKQPEEMNGSPLI
jgi:2,3-bisphosphoglycerate-independent phosphoglycerate mutase